LSALLLNISSRFWFFGLPLMRRRAPCWDDFPGAMSLLFATPPDLTDGLGEGDSEKCVAWNVHEIVALTLQFGGTHEA